MAGKVAQKTGLHPEWISSFERLDAASKQVLRVGSILDAHRLENRHEHKDYWLLYGPDQMRFDGWANCWDICTEFGDDRPLPVLDFDDFDDFINEMPVPEPVATQSDQLDSHVSGIDDNMVVAEPEV
ncbi:hypothetical protein PM082_016842 [Marasmius tenuissimus]|nr:hypothetical protein PM082_016842 [Marasmius tenuissimus]